MQHIQQLIHESPVVLFSSSTCHYSTKAKRMLSELYPILVPAVKVIEIDVPGENVLAPESEYRLAFKELSGATSTPRLFIQGQCIGGADDMEKLKQQGELQTKIQQAMGSMVLDENIYDRKTLLTVCTKKDYTEVVSGASTIIPRFKYGLLHSYNLTQILQSKGQSFSSEVTVLEVCNPGHACQVLKKNPQISSALPCRISVWKDDKNHCTVIQTIQPNLLIGMFGGDEELKKIAEQVQNDLYTIMLQMA